jgi:hypothetical protein
MRCFDEDCLAKLSEVYDDAFLSQYVDDIHKQRCSTCGNKGSVDLYVSHTVTAFLIHFSWSESPNVCCRRCGVRHIVEGIVWTLILGWWQIPFGIVAAPWQIFKGFKRLISLPDLRYPSPEFVKMQRLKLAKRMRIPGQFADV